MAVNYKTMEQGGFDWDNFQGGFQDILNKALPWIMGLITKDPAQFMASLGVQQERGQAEEHTERALGIYEDLAGEFRTAGDYARNIGQGLPTIRYGDETLFSPTAGTPVAGRTTPVGGLLRYQRDASIPLGSYGLDASRPGGDFTKAGISDVPSTGYAPAAPTAPGGSTTPAPEGIDLLDIFTSGTDFEQNLIKNLEAAGISLGGMYAGTSQPGGRIGRDKIGAGGPGRLGRGGPGKLGEFIPGVGIDVGASLGQFDESEAAGTGFLLTGQEEAHADIDEARGFVSEYLDKGFLDPGELASQLDLDNILKAELQGLGRAGATSLQSGRENIASMAGQYGGLENVQLQQAGLAQTLQGITGGLGLQAKAHDTIRRADLTKTEAQINQALAGIGAGIEGTFGAGLAQGDLLTGQQLANLTGQYAFKRPELENLLSTTNYNMQTGLASMLAGASMGPAQDQIQALMFGIDTALKEAGVQGGLASLNLQALGREAGVAAPWSDPLYFSETSAMPWNFPGWPQLETQGGGDGYVSELGEMFPLSIFDVMS